MKTGITIEIERDGSLKRVDVSELSNLELHGAFVSTARPLLEAMVIGLAAWIRETVNFKAEATATGAHVGLTLHLPDDMEKQPAHEIIVSLCDQFGMPGILPLLFIAAVDLTGGDFSRPTGGNELIERALALQQLVPAMRNLNVSEVLIEHVEEAEGDKPM